MALWALAHPVPNGDLASMILFGVLAVLALAGSALIDAKLARAMGESWQRYAGHTSNLPFAAMVHGKQRLRCSEVGWWRTLVAIILYVALLHTHTWALGASPFPG